MRLACLIYPFQPVRQENGAVQGRVNRQHVARRALHAVRSGCTSPKPTLYTAQALMTPRRSPTRRPKDAAVVFFLTRVFRKRWPSSVSC